MSRPAVYIAAAARTPVGAYLGSLASLSAPDLGARAIGAVMDRSGVDPSRIEDVFLGNVLSAGIGQAPARQAALRAGLPDSVPCTGVSKVCGSGLQAVILGCRVVALGEADLVVAGGMEAMSQAPYYLKKAREGYRMGNGELIDGMICDGLWDPYDNAHMGQAGELCASEFKLSREAQDSFAKTSYERALAAQREGRFEAEIVPVEVAQRRGAPLRVEHDEEPARCRLDKFGELRPAFKKDGTITAANASSINDGAAAVLLASETAVKDHNLKPLARVLGYGGAAQAPRWFTTAPARAIDVTLSRLGLKSADIDLWEINEAFSCVTMACSQLAGLDPDAVNVNGGAVALGHPIGASGARILTTLLFALQQRDLRRGLATLCIGGGEAVAMVVERV